MNSVNLIPLEVQKRIARLARMRSWGILLGAFAVCLALVGAVVRIGLSSRTSDLTRQISEAEQAVRRLDGEQATLKVQLTSVKRRLDAARATGRHPNWGLLLNVIANALNERTTLDSMELGKTKVEAAAKSDGKKPTKPAVDVTVTVKGRSQSMESMGEFLASLEKTGVFRQVKLGDNHRADAAGMSVIEFQVVCVLDASAVAGAEVQK